MRGHQPGSQPIDIPEANTQIRSYRDRIPLRHQHRMNSRYSLRNLSFQKSKFESDIRASDQKKRLTLRQKCNDLMIITSA